MIPKVIYMCYKTLDKIKIYSQNWKRLNPEYEIKLYDDNLCREFLLKEYSQLHVDIFDFIKDGPIKSDFWRCCIINKYGGLYVDADIEPLVPLREYIEGDEYFVTCFSANPGELNPHFIMCDKNNSILQYCINKYINYYSNKLPYKYWVWSIVKILKFNFNGYSGIYIIDNKKYKFLSEMKTYNDCEYNGRIVLHNRYKEYINHEFT
jgi:hypothetical protein